LSLGIYLSPQVLGWTGNNVTVNDTQNTALGTNPNNSFQPENHLHCFTHTLNLGVKSFLLPFQPPEKKKNGNTITDDESDADDDTSSELPLDLDDDDSSLPDLADASDRESLADDDGEEDVWDDMDEVEKADVIEQTKQAKAVISRVCPLLSRLNSRTQSFQVRKFSFALVHSTTKALPAWRSACGTKNMAVRLLPRDVRTRWNSTYDMLVVAVQYKDVVNAVTADRNLPLRKYELSDSDWMIVEDMVYTLEASA
jgi:hypothetical protein